MSINKHVTEESDSSAPDLKIPYRKPKLIVYGDLRRITRAVGMTTNTDNGMGSNTKTG